MLYDDGQHHHTALVRLLETGVEGVFLRILFRYGTAGYMHGDIRRCIVLPACENL